MKKLIAKLNEKKIFHVVSAEGDKVEVLTMPADLADKDKQMLKDYYGLADYSVPKAQKNPFINKASTLFSNKPDGDPFRKAAPKAK